MEYEDNLKPEVRFGTLLDLFLCSQHSELKTTDIGQPFVTYPALQAPLQESHNHLKEPKHHSRLTQGLRKAATETRLVTIARHTVEYDTQVY